MTRSGYESPEYTVVEKQEPFEIRDYPEIVVVSVSGKAPEGEMNQNFNQLFGYISGKNESEQKIAMTTPVYVNEDTSEQTMSFVLPSTVVKDGVPEPQSENVFIDTIKSGQFAVYRFNGSTDSASREQARAKLVAWAQKQELAFEGRVMFAFFDPPWTPGPLRRNEAMVRLNDSAQ